MEERIKLMSTMDNMSLLTDFKIIPRTFSTINREGLTVKMNGPR